MYVWIYVQIQTDTYMCIYIQFSLVLYNILYFFIVLYDTIVYYIIHIYIFEFIIYIYTLCLYYIFSIYIYIIFALYYLMVNYAYFQRVSTKEILSGDDDSLCHVPGGFGACGGPNDGWHQHLHMVTRAFLSAQVGWGNAPQLRKKLEDISFSMQGMPESKCTMSMSIRADAWALHELGTSTCLSTAWVYIYICFLVCFVLFCIVDIYNIYIHIYIYVFSCFDPLYIQYLYIYIYIFFSAWTFRIGLHMLVTQYIIYMLVQCLGTTCWFGRVGCTAVTSPSKVLPHGTLRAASSCWKRASPESVAEWKRFATWRLCQPWTQSVFSQRMRR